MVEVAVVVGEGGVARLSVPGRGWRVCLLMSEALGDGNVETD
jgi:hypothetical protein